MRLWDRARKPAPTEACDLVAIAHFLERRCEAALFWAG